MKLLLLLISCFLFFGFIKKRETNKFESNISSLPIVIRYLGKMPPDSIHTFLKTVLQLKKYKIISMDEVRELIFAQIQGVSTDWMYSGKLTGIDRDNSVKEKLNNEMSKAVSNLLFAKFFSKAGSDGSYSIDSIHWEVKQVPGSDSIFRHNSFVPSPEDNINSYVAIKKFSELVLESGQIK